MRVAQAVQAVQAVQVVVRWVVARRAAGVGEGVTEGSAGGPGH